MLIVTGRASGWASALVTDLPVVGAIAENGGLFYPGDNSNPVGLASIPNVVRHRQRLADAYQYLKAEFLQIQESTDNCGFSRLGVGGGGWVIQCEKMI